MLYLEAPAGVGYSYSADKNYTTDDDQVVTIFSQRENVYYHPLKSLLFSPITSSVTNL